MLYAIVEEIGYYDSVYNVLGYHETLEEAEYTVKILEFKHRLEKKKSKLFCDYNVTHREYDIVEIRKDLVDWNVKDETSFKRVLSQLQDIHGEEIRQLKSTYKPRPGVIL
jgi:hypothetical protein